MQITQGFKADLISTKQRQETFFKVADWWLYTFGESIGNYEINVSIDGNIVEGCTSTPRLGNRLALVPFMHNEMIILVRSR